MGIAIDSSPKDFTNILHAVPIPFNPRIGGFFIPSIQVSRAAVSPEEYGISEQQAFFPDTRDREDE